MSVIYMQTHTHSFCLICIFVHIHSGFSESPTSLHRKHFRDCRTDFLQASWASCRKIALD